LAAETNSSKITLIFGGSHRKQRTFSGLVGPVKINPTFGGNYFRRLLSAIFGGLFCGDRQNLKATKNDSALFSVVFP
jgi:hypothetical protein